MDSEDDFMSAVSSEDDALQDEVDYSETEDLSGAEGEQLMSIAIEKPSSSGRDSEPSGALSGERSEQPQTCVVEGATRADSECGFLLPVIPGPPLYFILWSRLTNFLSVPRLRFR
jgi:hypothetical protein